MDRQYIDDHHIVARYLADQLSEPERAGFEAYFLEHPEIVREIEAAARFKAALAQLRDGGELTPLLKPAPWYGKWHYLAIAVAMVIVVMGVTFFIRASAPPAMVADVTSLGGAAQVANSYSVLRRRGGPFDAEVTLPATGRAIALRVLPEFISADSRYRVYLSRIDMNDQKEQIAQLDDLPADDDSMVNIYLNAARIEPGDYEVALSDEETQTSRFLIRVLR